MQSCDDHALIRCRPRVKWTEFSEATAGAGVLIKGEGHYAPKREGGAAGPSVAKGLLPQLLNENIRAVAAACRADGREGTAKLSSE